MGKTNKMLLFKLELLLLLLLQQHSLCLITDNSRGKEWKYCIQMHYVRMCRNFTKSTVIFSTRNASPKKPSEELGGRLKW